MNLIKCSEVIYMIEIFKLKDPNEPDSILILHGVTSFLFHQVQPSS